MLRYTFADHLLGRYVEEVKTGHAISCGIALLSRILRRSRPAGASWPFPLSGVVGISGSRRSILPAPWINHLTTKCLLDIADEIVWIF